VIGWLFGLGAVLVAAGWLLRRRRLNRLDGSELTDEVVQRIEASGRVEVDEPLDLDEAAEEEARFWGESWDPPEPM